ncbi:MAG: hypothetical protein JJ869_16400 [Marivita sp.]|uniref:hypothetical protein n=1 Tax=Marivita sp. TaxID=2003365 RepID=UPI001B0979E7|nr:hypothetical protein [Marivita sp.]MBO6885139.1 hypothetical protein [Marivita sp.]
MNILVYPFTDARGIDKYFKTIYVGWSNQNKAMMFLDPSDVRHQPLKYLDSQTVLSICLLGHCDRGSELLRSETSYLADETDQAEGKTATAAQIVHLLTNLGMTNSTRTRIKCLNCDSGAFAHEFDEFGQSFASRLKERLNGSGFGDITVIGYIGSLTLIPNKVPPDVPHRKFAIIDTEHGKKAFPGSNLKVNVEGNYDKDAATEQTAMQKILNFSGETGIKL